MNINLVARRYAQALYEAAQQNDSIASVIEDMETITRILDGAPPIREYCLRTDRDLRNETKFVNTAFIPYVSSFTARMLQEMAKNNRASSLPYLSKAFQEIHNEKEDTVTLEIEASYQPSDSELEDIKKKMASRIGKKIKVRTRVLPELLGGFRIIWQNRILDLSVRGRLNQMRRKILDTTI